MGTEDQETTVVYLGNRNAVEGRYDTETGRMTPEVMPYAKRCTKITLPPGLTLMEAATDITHQRGVWAAHAEKGAVPAWVASTDPALAQLLASHFKCELRDPEPDHATSGNDNGQED